MSAAGPTLIYEDRQFVASRTGSCAVPGYLIVEPKDAIETLAELPPDAATRLGPLLGRISAAIAEATSADRVYCLLFAEEKRAIHFHLFPRAPWLLDAYRAHLGSEQTAVSAPQLFEWARFAHADDADLPPGVATWTAVEPILRRRLGPAASADSGPRVG